MDRLIGQHAVLVEFWDFARVNSLRTLPYLQAWHERYAEAGLQVIGVHSPGYSFGRDREVVERAVERLELAYPVLLDPDLEVWRLLRQPRLAGPLPLRPAEPAALRPLRGGRVPETELAIQECLREIDGTWTCRRRWSRCAPRTCPGVLLEPQTADIALPADRDRLELVRDWNDGEDWIEAADAGARGELQVQRGRRVRGAVGRRAWSRGSTRPTAP